ncbi:MAG: L,D-transpeptidase [Elainellaceae cyanobacterium]
MGGRESLAQTFTLLSFLSAGLLGLSSLPMWNQATETPQSSSSSQSDAQASVSTSDVVVPMGVWILGSSLAEPLQASSGFASEGRATATDAADAKVENENAQEFNDVAATSDEAIAPTRPVRADAVREGSVPLAAAGRSESFLPTASSPETRAYAQSSTEAREAQSVGDRDGVRQTSSRAASRERRSTSATAPVANREIVVDLSDRQVSLYQDNQLQSLFPIAIGRVGWETPVGQFEVIEKQPNPVWQNPITEEIVEPGPNNPLGARWIGFWSDGKNQLGFHGTNQTELIGQAVSHGCIRLRNEDIERLYDEVAMGTPVRIQP